MVATDFLKCNCQLHYSKKNLTQLTQRHRLPKNGCLKLCVYHTFVMVQTLSHRTKWQRKKNYCLQEPVTKVLKSATCCSNTCVTKIRLLNYTPGG